MASGCSSCSRSGRTSQSAPWNVITSAIGRPIYVRAAPWRLAALVLALAGSGVVVGASCASTADRPGTASGPRVIASSHAAVVAKPGRRRVIFGLAGTRGVPPPGWGAVGPACGVAPDEGRAVRAYRCVALRASVGVGVAEDAPEGLDAVLPADLLPL